MRKNIKNRGLFYIALLGLSLSIPLTAEEGLPNRFELLTRNYEQAIERVQKPIKQKYITELKKLHREITAAGDLDQALQITKKLKDIGAIEKTLRDLLLETPWLYTAGKNNAKFIFLPDGTINGENPWKLDDDLTLTISYSDGNSCTFKFKDLKNLSVEGRTKRDNGVRYLKPID